MLRSTFLHIQGVGRETEQALWDRGIRDWSDLLAQLPNVSLGSASKESARRRLLASERALAEGNHQFFARALRTKEAWRAWETFRDRCLYLDIETDGGNSPNSITVIGAWDGRHHHALVQGESLGSFRDLLSHASMIVTFYGGKFDLPVLQKKFKDVPFDQIHFDLHPAFHRLGVRGGLKKIEEEMGIVRPEAVRGMNGYDAVKLWRRYRMRHDEDALASLIAYNREDCVNMERLAEICFARLQSDMLGEVCQNPML